MPSHTGPARVTATKLLGVDMADFRGSPPAQTLVDELASGIRDRLPLILQSLFGAHHDGMGTERLLLNCQLSIVDPNNASHDVTRPVASVDISQWITSPVPPSCTHPVFLTTNEPPTTTTPPSLITPPSADTIPPSLAATPLDNTSTLTRSRKRKHHTSVAPTGQSSRPNQPPRDPGLHLTTRTTNGSIKPAADAAPDKLISGIWKALFSDNMLDPSQLFQASHGTETHAELMLLGGPENDVLAESNSDTIVARNLFSRVNLMARKISQTSKVCRAVEIIIQARWVQCFDDRVQALALTRALDVAKKCAMAEACSDFGWSDKELRNKMCIWRGYQDIARHGGIVTLIFAGPGLYRFCKYRTSFNEDTFQKLRTLRPAFEVVADTLHPCWRNMPGFLGIPHVRKYTGHPHDWVIGAPHGEPVTLASTYRKWDPNFSYEHINESSVDEDVWGNHDPRSTCTPGSAEADICKSCGQRQADDYVQNQCDCFPSLYGHAHPKQPPVQIAQTNTGKNNGLFACLDIAVGEAIGEFVGQITKGVAGADVMFGQTDMATYQIWQGKKGNYTRFINHSCRPNSQYEHFNWCGTQRIVLVSQGIRAGEEITVDYSDTYWQVSGAAVDSSREDANRPPGLE